MRSSPAYLRSEELVAVYTLDLATESSVESEATDVGAYIAGGVVGGVLVLVALSVALAYRWRHHPRLKHSPLAKCFPCFYSPK